jgi:pSer/pThr/pTyr-binding forkhead associated (FHA) protein
MGGAQKALWLAVALFSLVLFLMVLRKPRTIMVDAMSRVVSIGRKSPSPAAHVSPRPVQQVSPPPTHQQPVPAPKPASAPFVLRGRDLQGRSYQLPFSPADFARAGGRLVIGRSHDLCGLCIRHDSISRQHATLTLAGSELRIEDRNSGNGTVVNGRKLIVGTPPVPLRHGDRISLGEVDLVFESAS